MNEAERAETRINSTVAREFEIALPHELSPMTANDWPTNLLVSWSRNMALQPMWRFMPHRNSRRAALGR
ncbi:MobA/MobL family protein (plasmid) [Klebsiella quasipneumoniae]|nr:MobA/MobL family protein [Klebsiella quasipneumoniae]